MKKLKVAVVQTLWTGVQVNANDSNSTDIEPGAGTLPQEQSHSSDHSFVLPYNTFPIGCFSSFLPSLAFRAFICWGSVHLMSQKSFLFGLMTNSNCYGHLVFILKVKAIKRR